MSIVVNSSSEIYCVSEAKRIDGVVTSATKNGLYKYPAFHLCLVATMASLRVYRDYVIKIFFKINIFAVVVQRTFNLLVILIIRPVPQADLTHMNLFL